MGQGLMQAIPLADTEPFARGGNRVCYVDPGNPAVCIKLLRSDRSPQRKRSKKSFPKSLKPLHYFDDNLQEWNTYQRIHRRVGDGLHTVCARLYGLVDTDLGEGLACELIRDGDGRVSLSLKQVLWENGLTEELQRALDEFATTWASLAVPSRDLLLHNLVVQRAPDTRVQRLVVIDGIGWPGVFQLDRIIPGVGRARVRRRLENLRQRVDELLTHQAKGGGKGYHGFIDPDKRRGGHERR